MERAGNEIRRSFVPEILMDYLSKQIRLGQGSIKPASFMLHGVCLLIDIPGFTKVLGDFCAQGKSGIDGLQSALNVYMGKLIKAIYSFGGDIIKFAGDAIICIFPSTLVTMVTKDYRGNIFRRSVVQSDNPNKAVGTNLGLSLKPRPSNFLNRSPKYSANQIARRKESILPDHVLRAMNCANELRTIRTEFLTARVAISCGEMCFGVLGGYENRWECLISGPCLQELFGCQDEAPSMMTASCAVNREQSASGAQVAVDESVHRGRSTGQGAVKADYEYLATCESNILSVTKRPERAMAPAAVSASADSADKVLQSMIQQFAPEIVNDATTRGANVKYLSEMREVATMFMKWDSYDPRGQHQDLIELQDCFFEAQKILHTTGAYLRQFLVDDKGCVLIACWGMPSQVYMDNANRALTAAVEIRTALLLLQMKCSFGITTGDVYCGTVGSALRMEYAAIGNVVNMSARLMGKAHGGILIDEATYMRLPPSTHGSLVKLPPLQGKGQTAPVRVYEYVAAQGCPPQQNSPDPGPTPSTSKISKNSHDVRACCAQPFTAVLTAMDNRKSVKSMMQPYSPTSPSRSSRMQVLLLEGKEGAGCKSSQVWLQKQAITLSIQVVYVSLAEVSRHYSYYLLYKIFAQLAPKDMYTSKITQRRYVHALLNEVYPDDADMAVKVAFPIMKTALAMTCTLRRDADNNDTSVSFAPNRSAKSIKIVRESSIHSSPSLILEVLCTIFTHLLTERTVLVIIDDIHNSDEESLRVLVELLKIDSRSAIVMNGIVPSEVQGSIPHNPIDQTANESKYANLVKSSVWELQYRALVALEPNVTVIPVGAFTVSEIGAMLQAIPASASFPPSLGAAVSSLSGGEFFWIREIMHYLRDNGADRFLTTFGCNEGRVSSSAEECVDNVVAAQASKLEQLVVCRYENLDPATKQILCTASIIGPTFSRSVLYGVLPRNLKVVLSASLRTLVQQQWLEPHSNDAGVYEFRHVYSHQIIYNITPESERRNLHKVIADYIEEISAGDASQAAQLCHHYGMCDRDKALFYTYQATMFLLENGSFFELSVCADLLLRAVEYCHTPHSVRDLTYLTNQVIKMTSDVETSGRWNLQFLRRLLRFGLCRPKSTAVYISDDSDRTHQSVPPAGALGGDERQKRLHDAPHHFQTQLHNVLHLLLKRKPTMGPRA